MEEDVDENDVNPKESCIAWRRKDEVMGRSVPRFLRNNTRYQVVGVRSSMLISRIDGDKEDRSWTDSRTLKQRVDAIERKEK